jgi:hypothetical protein
LCQPSVAHIASPLHEALLLQPRYDSGHRRWSYLLRRREPSESKRAAENDYGERR